MDKLGSESGIVYTWNSIIGNRLAVVSSTCTSKTGGIRQGSRHATGGVYCNDSV
jgi:hypothetical protein